MMPKTLYLAVIFEKEQALYCQNDADEMMCPVGAFQLIFGFAVVVVCDIYGCKDTISGAPDTPIFEAPRSPCFSERGRTVLRGQGVPTGYAYRV